MRISVAWPHSQKWNGHDWQRIRQLVRPYELDVCYGKLFGVPATGRGFRKVSGKAAEDDEIQAVVVELRATSEIRGLIPLNAKVSVEGQVRANAGGQTAMDDVFHICWLSWEGRQCSVELSVIASDFYHREPERKPKSKRDRKQEPGEPIRPGFFEVRAKNLSARTQQKQQQSGSKHSAGLSASSTSQSTSSPPAEARRATREATAGGTMRTVSPHGAESPVQSANPQASAAGPSSSGSSSSSSARVVEIVD